MFSQFLRIDKSHKEHYKKKEDVLRSILPFLYKNHPAFFNEALEQL